MVILVTTVLNKTAQLHSSQNHADLLHMLGYALDNKLQKIESTCLHKLGPL